MRSKSIIVIGSIIISFIGYLFLVDVLTSCNNVNRKQLAANDYIGPQKCKSCHLQQDNLWHSSDHFKAMLPATDSTVFGNFNNITFTADGVTSHFFRRGKDYYINTQAAGGKNEDFKVLYTFGYYPLQQYLIAFPGGHMQVPRVSWDAKEKKWFHQYAHQNIPSNNWLHWTGASQNWNTMCASCHSTNLQKNYNVEADTFKTTFSAINVSCESCHGPGKNHVEYISSGDYKKGKKVPGSYIRLLKTQTDQINTCSPCHARKSEISNEQLATGEFLDNYIPEIPTTEHFYADGQIKDEDYIYASFLQSKMMHRGVTCSNCHNSHSGKVLFSSNTLCLQCHSKTLDAPSHSFHAVNTEGAQCMNCHMPGRIYMGNDYRHDHSFRVPRPDLSVMYGTPNACNNCHKDQSFQWAANAVVKWYGHQRKYHFAEDLVPGSKTDANSEPHLLKLLRDTAVPNIIKATSLYYLGSILTPGSSGALRNALQNPDALIRFNAIRSLSDFPPSEWKDEAAPLLSDKVRAVRIAAADLFMSIPVEQVPMNAKTAFERAKEDRRKFLYYQVDFAEGNIMMGDYYLKLNDYESAQKYYLRALKKDSLLNYARINLSVAFSAKGRNREALKTLNEAALISPKNDRIFFNLALLNIEMKDTIAAMKNFEKGVNLKSSNPRLYYNYGLILYQKGKYKKADQIVRKGLEISPSDNDLQTALQYIHRQ
jgi:tetratricopeptide (TPR) repeat protein